MPTQIVNNGTPTTGPAGTQQCHDVRVFVNETFTATNPRIRVTSGSVCNVTPTPDTVTGASVAAGTGCYVEDTPGAGFTVGWAAESNISFEATDGATFFIEDDISSPAFADYWWDVDTWAAPTIASSRVKGDPQESFVEATITTGQLSNAVPNQGEVTATGPTTVAVEFQRRAPGQVKDDVTVTVDAPATITELDAANGIWEVCRDSAAGGTFNHVLTATNGVDATTATIGASFTFTGAPPVNNPPTITGLDDQTGPVGTAQSDTFMVADGDGTVVSVTSAPAGATLTDNGGGSWTISYTPAAAGATTFTVTVEDDDGATATDDVTFTGTVVAGGTPTCGPTTAITTTGATIRGDTTGTAPGEDFRLVWGEVAGGPYPNESIGIGGGTTATVTLTGLTPCTDYYYRAEVVDGAPPSVQRASTECTFKTLCAPIISDVQDQTGTVNTLLSDDVTVVDVDDAVVTLTAAPPGAVLTNNGGGSWTVAYTPTAVGATTFTLTATDDDGNTDTAEITFTGTAAAPTPRTPGTVPAPCDDDGGAGGDPVRSTSSTVDDECLTDDNGVFFRRTSSTDDGNGGRNVTVSTVDVAGAAYVPVGTVRPCETQQDPATAINLRAHVVDLGAGQSWTPADVPAGETLTSVTMAVASGIANVVDVDGTAANGLPTSYSNTWTAEDGNTLAPPQSITSQATPTAPGRTIVTFTTRA